MSAHHYFRDFFYCDSGMIPWLLIINLISNSGKTFSELVKKRIQCFPSLGEINRKIANPYIAIDRVKNHYIEKASKVDRTNDISMEFKEWRFNLRCSNTKPVVRLNVETRADMALLKRKTEDIIRLLDQ